MSKEKKQLIDNWNKTIKSFDIIAKQFNGFFKDLPKDLTIDKSEIDKINILFSISVDENVSLKNHLETQKSRFEILEHLPISKIENNKEELLIQYQEKKEEYSSLKEYITNFEEKLNLEKIQLNNLSKQQKRTDQEIIDQNNLKKVFSQNCLLYTSPSPRD